MRRLLRFLRSLLTVLGTLVLRDVVFRRRPFRVDGAETMIRGARGRRPADVPALAAMLARLSVFAVQAGERAFAASAVIEVGE